jgi:Flp pilus assembly protein TadG
MDRVSAAFRGFLTRDDGGALPLAAAAMLTLVGFAGVALDGARLIYAKDVLQRSLDAGGLAAGHALEVEHMTGDGRDFFDANVAAGGDILRGTQLTIAVSPDNRVLTLTATAEVESTFMRVFGFDAITVSATTEVTRETRGMELALVMDNTGSMRSGGKIGAMKTAATSLVNSIYGDDEVNPNLWVALVPYTATVNIGGGRTGWLDLDGQAAITNGDFETTSWKGCVEARGGTGDRTDDPPALDPFPLYFYADEVDNDWILAGGGFDIDETNDAQNNGTGPNLGCGPPITPLTAAKTPVLQAIDDMLPWHRGGTTSNLGLVWGWRALSPRWRGLWGGATPAELPLGYDEPFMDKVIVVLTDGQNQFFDHEGGGPQGSDYTAYDRLNVFGYSTLDEARAEIDARFAELCGSIKTEGITIFAITFGSTPNASTQALYRTCASNPGFYFHAPSNDELQDVFDTIGRQLSNLRLSK